MQNPERFSEGVFIYGAVGTAEEMLVHRIISTQGETHSQRPTQDSRGEKPKR